MKKQIDENICKHLDKTKQRGITLIALVITIIVLLILAGVSVATLTGDNGLLTRAGGAKETTEYKTAEEELRLIIAEYPIVKYTTNIGLTFEGYLRR